MADSHQQLPFQLYLHDKGYSFDGFQEVPLIGRMNEDSDPTIRFQDRSKLRFFSSIRNVRDIATQHLERRIYLAQAFTVTATVHLYSSSFFLVGQKCFAIVPACQDLLSTRARNRKDVRQFQVSKAESLDHRPSNQEELVCNMFHKQAQIFRSIFFPEAGRCPAIAHLLVLERPFLQLQGQRNANNLLCCNWDYVKKLGWPKRVLPRRTGLFSGRSYRTHLNSVCMTAKHGRMATLQESARCLLQADRRSLAPLLPQTMLQPSRIAKATMESM
mmetsp:Transcript_50317/g.117394  ORF Transcript_50317/g.117394 Transcript_50317/m.117394 type:complete len:273 (+) Transcript_50317:330-1148(+)